MKNLPDGTAEVIAEAPKNTLEKFIQAVKIQEPPIKVDDLKIRFSEATGGYEFFNIVYGELTEEMAEGFGTDLKYINLSRKENKQGLQTLGSEVREMHKDVNASFQEMSEKYDVISQNLGDAVKIIQEESTKTREELIRVVDNLSKIGASVSEEHIRYARVLDRYYIPTRYPNAFERGAAHEYFLEKDAREAIRLAEEIISIVKREAEEA